MALLNEQRNRFPEHESGSYPAGVRLGILSDSHGQVERTRRAVDLLLSEQVRADVIIHLGDVCDERVIDALSGLGRPVHLVFGNCDLDWREQAEYARSIGLVVDHPIGVIRIGPDQRVAFAHGDVIGHEQGAIERGIAFYLHGHTHLVRDERYRRTRVVNPGALFRAARYTVAMIDVTGDHVEILEIPRPA